MNIKNVEVTQTATIICVLKNKQPVKQDLKKGKYSNKIRTKEMGQ